MNIYSKFCRENLCFLRRRSTVHKFHFNTRHVCDYCILYTFIQLYYILPCTTNSIRNFNTSFSNISLNWWAEVIKFLYTSETVLYEIRENQRVSGTEHTPIHTFQSCYGFGTHNILIWTILQSVTVCIVLHSRKFLYCCSYMSCYPMSCSLCLNFNYPNKENESYWPGLLIGLTILKTASNN